MMLERKLNREEQPLGFALQELVRVQSQPQAHYTSIASQAE